MTTECVMLTNTHSGALASTNQRAGISGRDLICRGPLQSTVELSNLEMKPVTREDHQHWPLKVFFLDKRVQVFPFTLVEILITSQYYLLMTYAFVAVVF